MVLLLNGQLALKYLCVTEYKMKDKCAATENPPDFT